MMTSSPPAGVYLRTRSRRLQWQILPHVPTPNIEVLGVTLGDIKPAALDEFALARLPNVCSKYDVIHLHPLEVVHFEVTSSLHRLGLEDITADVITARNLSPRVTSEAAEHLDLKSFDLLGERHRADVRSDREQDTGSVLR